jgi:serine/threonine protein phosphatase 1
MFYQILKPYKPNKYRRFVIGDIHGCYHSFKKMIEKKIVPTKKDKIFLLGDYINKGPHSAKTVDYILNLISEGYRIYPLRGNHEDTVLRTEEESPEILSWLLKDSPDLLENKRLKPKYRDFFKSLPYYYELDKFFIVHAGFNFKKEEPFKDKISMLWRRKFDNDYNFTGGKTIIHGHQPENIEQILESINKKSDVIGLDNGVCYIKNHKIYDYRRMGNLLALNIDTFELFIQKNNEEKNKSK